MSCVSKKYTTIIPNLGQKYSRQRGWWSGCMEVKLWRPAEDVWPRRPRSEQKKQRKSTGTNAPSWLHRVLAEVVLWAGMAALSSLILNQSSAEGEQGGNGEGGGVEEEEGREKVWFHMQVVVKDVYPKRPVSLLLAPLPFSRFSHEQKFSWVHSDSLTIEWRPWLTKQALRYYCSPASIWSFTFGSIDHTWTK